MENLDDFIMSRPPTASRPLLGLTVLVVEDSRFACEALRLLCLRSGARIRRADTLEHARQHLRVYRPSVVIIDMGLPDGSGAELIADLTAASPRISVVIGMSGDSDTEAMAMQAGADAFMVKPIGGLASFQSAILQLLPPERQPRGPRLVDDETIIPDPLALRDDLEHIAEVLRSTARDKGQENDAGGTPDIDYVTQFLRGVAKSAKDTDLGQAVSALVARRQSGGKGVAEQAQLTAILTARLAAPLPFI